MQAEWVGVIACAGLAAVAALAERRRARRTMLDRVGWMPWPGILLAALFAGAICLALVLHR